MSDDSFIAPCCVLCTLCTCVYLCVKRRHLKIQKETDRITQQWWCRSVSFPAFTLSLCPQIGLIKYNSGLPRRGNTAGVMWREIYLESASQNVAHTGSLNPLFLVHSFVRNRCHNSCWCCIEERNAAVVLWQPVFEGIVFMIFCSLGFCWPVLLWPGTDWVSLVGL